MGASAPLALQSEKFTIALSLESGCMHTHTHARTPHVRGFCIMQVLVLDPER